MLKTLWNILLGRTRYYYFTLTVLNTTSEREHTYAVEHHIRLDKHQGIAIVEIFGMPVALSGKLQLIDIKLTGEYWA